MPAPSFSNNRLTKHIRLPANLHEQSKHLALQLDAGYEVVCNIVDPRTGKTVKQCRYTMEGIQYIDIDSDSQIGTSIVPTLACFSPKREAENDLSTSTIDTSAGTEELPKCFSQNVELSTTEDEEMNPAFVNPTVEPLPSAPDSSSPVSTVNYSSRGIFEQFEEFELNAFSSSFGAFGGDLRQTQTAPDEPTTAIAVAVAVAIEQVEQVEHPIDPSATEWTGFASTGSIDESNSASRVEIESPQCELEPVPDMEDERESKPDHFERIALQEQEELPAQILDAPLPQPDRFHTYNQRLALIRPGGRVRIAPLPVPIPTDGRALNYLDKLRQLERLRRNRERRNPLRLLKAFKRLLVENRH